MHADTIQFAGVFLIVAVAAFFVAISMGVSRLVFRLTGDPTTTA
jgi:hypothetical protein